MVSYQRGESQLVTILLLVAVIAVLMYLFITGEINIGGSL